MNTWEKYLERIYKNPRHPGSFSGPLKLYQAVKNEGKFIIGLGRISKWLKGNSTYTFNRIAHRKFKRNSVVVEGVDSLWDADLIDFNQYKKKNDNNCYILLMIDIFSRYTYLRPLLTKNSADVIRAMRSIFDKGRKPKVLRTDKGGEFTNVAITAFYKNVDIHHYVTFNETQANYAERCIKTIKTKLYRYMKENNVNRYIDIIDDVVEGYNNSIHRSIGTKPLNVNKGNEDEIRLQQYLLKHRNTIPKGEIKKSVNKIPEKQKKKKKKKNKKKIYSFKIGDTVRISMIKEKFDREYDQKWTTETFTVSHRFLRESIPIYNINDWSGERVEGSFYTKEMQSVIVGEDEEYIVEKVVKVTGKDSFVKWRGWPKKFNSWIPSKNVKIL